MEDIVCNNMLSLLPRDMISYILSFNGYEIYNKIYVKKIDYTFYNIIRNYFINRVTVFTQFTRTGVCVLFSSDDENEEENLNENEMKVLTINYGYNPVHITEYQIIAVEMGDYNNQADPFNPNYPISYVKDRGEETMFYSINRYLFDRDILFIDSMVYIPELNVKFTHHRFKELNLLSMEEDPHEVEEEEEFYNEEHYDQEYYQNYM